VSHSHRASSADDLRIGRSVIVWLLAALGIVGALTVAGVVLLWPDGTKLAAIREHTPFAAPGVTWVSPRSVETSPLRR
jgi:hypothetical protein